MSGVPPKLAVFELGRRLSQLKWNATHAIAFPCGHYERLVRRTWKALENLTIEVAPSERGGQLREHVRRLARNWEVYFGSEHYGVAWQDAFIEYAKAWNGEQQLVEAVLGLVPYEIERADRLICDAYPGAGQERLLLQLGRCIDECVRPPHFASELRYRVVPRRRRPRHYTLPGDAQRCLHGIRCRLGSLPPSPVWSDEVRRLWEGAELGRPPRVLTNERVVSRARRCRVVRALVKRAHCLLADAAEPDTAWREGAHGGTGDDENIVEDAAAKDWPPNDGWRFDSSLVATFDGEVFEVNKGTHGGMGDDGNTMEEAMVVVWPPNEGLHFDNGLIEDGKIFDVNKGTHGGTGDDEDIVEDAAAEDWPPDDGWHFKDGLIAAFDSKVFDVKSGTQFRLLKALTGRFPRPEPRLIEAGWPGDTSGKKNLQNHLSQLRKVLRTAFGLEANEDPIPPQGRGRDVAWRLDSELLKKGSKKGAGRETG